MIDLRISRSPSLRAAHQRGFDARLRGVSRYSSPYEERPGWAGAYYRAWMTGWEIADAFALPADTVNVDDDYPEDAT
jgi:ribosome modulation factor